jgi:hypothetical protein
MNSAFDMKSIGPALKGHQKAQHAAAIRGLRLGATRGRTILVLTTPKDRGMAKAAWKTIFHGGTGIIATNENSAPYIGILECGSRPHAVSKEGQEAIYQWVLRNLRLVGNAREGYAAVHVNELHGSQRRRRLGSHDKGETLARQIAFLICRKLRKFGQAPKFFVRGALPNLHRAVRDEIERCMSEIKPGGRA